ncbi:GNVR domain-containing protein [Algoriphagus confluentis]
MNYLALIKEIFDKKRNLKIAVGIALFLGLIIAFTTPKEYQSTSFFLVESEGNTNPIGQFGALAGLAGINTSQFQAGQMALTSEIFPDVIQSRDFLNSIGKEEFVFESKGGISQSLNDYYYEEKPGNLVSKSFNFLLGIPNVVLAWFTPAPPVPTESTAVQAVEEENYLRFSSKELYAINQLKKRILVDEKGKTIRLTVTMPEPLISARVNALVMEKLIAYVTEYKLKRQRINMEFIQQRVAETQEKFNQAQLDLASFRDANQGLISQRARTREEKLQFEFNIAFNVYNSLKQEAEQTQIQLKKETPVFTVLEKAAIPLGPSKPNRPLILIFSVFLGFFVGAVFNLYLILIQHLKNTN